MIFLRIISGKYKGRNLKGFDIDGTRPTMDRMKESLFAMIFPYIKEKNCLDLFAGSGSLGLEALSNGANSCTFVDQNKIAIQILKENTKGMSGITIIHTNAFQLHQKTKQQFDLIFLDPPYQQNLITPSLNYLKEQNLLKKDALIVCEYEDEKIQIDSFEIFREKKYGKKKIIILKWNA